MCIRDRYPDTIEIAKINPERPLTLNIFWVRGLIKIPSISTIFKDTIKLAPIINGNNEGINIFNQIEIPPVAAFIADLGANTIPKIIRQITSFGAKKVISFFNFISSPYFWDFLINNDIF